MPNSQKLKRSSFEFYLDERDFYFLKLVDGSDISRSDMVAIDLFIETSFQGLHRPTLIELAYGTNVSEPVQQYLADTSLRHTTADAFLISTTAHRSNTTFYLRHQKPTSPTKVFQDLFEALDWLAIKSAMAS